MIGGQQGGRGLFFLSLLLGMKGHERHDEGRRGIATKKTVALGQNDPRTGLGGSQGCAQPGRPAADNQHIGFSGELRDAARQGNRTSVLRTTKRRHNLL
jgi:hypothetical protein